MTRITSRKNPLLQQVRKLLTSRAYREERGLFAADGTKLLAEAARWYPGLQTVIFAEGTELCPLPENVELVEIPKDVMADVSPMKAPQGALFLCKMPEEKPLVPNPGCLVLDGIQDPGNLGTILRTADAMEIPVVLLEGCADVYNWKTVRASMGAVFRTQPVRTTCEELLAGLSGIPLAVTALCEDTRDIREADLNACAVVIGSEGQGVRPELMDAAQQKLMIPMNPKCESLNAATAAAITLWQMRCGR